MSQYSPHMQRAIAVMLDGEWHDEEQLLGEMVKAINPGWAVRKAERMRVNQRASAKQTLPAKRAVERSTEFLRQVGSRHIALDALRQSKHLERQPKGSGFLVRIRPEVLDRLRAVIERAG